VIGVFYADSQMVNHEFSAADLPFFDAIGQQAALMLVNRRLVDAMLEAERLSTIGQATGMMLHDLAHPVMAIQGFAELLRQPGLSLDRVGQYSGRLVEESENVVTLIHSMREFVHDGRGAGPVPVDLGRVVTRAVDRLQALEPHRLVNVTLELLARRPVLADAFRLDRVVVNLVTRAFEAMPDGGQLRITSQDEAAAVELQISDTGAGIPAERLPDLFDPFVTWEQEGGTGLGLVIAKRLVEGFGGSIGVTSEADVGTTFTIRLPTAQ
jgi:signal transduction histidine kinase